MIQMLPPQIDVLAIVDDLREWGWLNYKIEVAAGLGHGYIAQVRCGNIREPAYGKAARLYNFWVQQQQDRESLQARVGSSARAHERVQSRS